MNHCKKCGNKIEKCDKYCTDCGYKVNNKVFSVLTYSLFAIMLFVGIFSLDGALNTVASSVTIDGATFDGTTFFSALKEYAFMVIALAIVVVLIVIIALGKSDKK